MRGLALFGTSFSVAAEPGYTCICSAELKPRTSPFATVLVSVLVSVHCVQSVSVALITASVASCIVTGTRTSSNRTAPDSTRGTTAAPRRHWLWSTRG